MPSNPQANGDFHLLYVGTTGVALSDEPQLLVVNLVRSNGPPALTGHYFVDILPQPDFFSGQKHFVASGRQVLPLAGVADLEPGDLVGVADAPLLHIPLGALQHTTHAAGPTLARLWTVRSLRSRARLTRRWQLPPCRRPRRR